MARRHKSRMPPQTGGVPIILPPRQNAASGVTVEYTDYDEPCVVCRQPSWVQIDGIALHSDRCLDYHRKIG